MAKACLERLGRMNISIMIDRDEQGEWVWREAGDGGKRKG
jgi:hypothetical protein